jgi:hypothetical protein
MPVMTNIGLAKPRGLLERAGRAASSHLHAEGFFRELSVSISRVDLFLIFMAVCFLQLAFIQSETTPNGSPPLADAVNMADDVGVRHGVKP